MNSKQKLISGSVVYAFGSILTQLIHIGFIKINTSILSTDEYGQYSLLLASIGILNVFLSLGISSGLTRFYKEVKDSNELKNIALSFAMVWSLFVFSLLLLIGKPISSMLIADTENAYLLFIIVAVSVIATIFITIYNVNYRMRYMAKKSIYIDLSVAIINLLLLFALGIGLEMKLLGVLLAYLIARIIVFGYLFVLDFRRFSFVVESKKLKRMLHYGVGLMMGNVAGWVLTFIDRYFLSAYYELTTVAIYSVVYRFGQMIQPVFLEPFKKIYTPFQLEVYKQKNGREKIKRVYRYFILIGWFVVLCFGLFSKPLIALLTTPEYGEAFRIVPLVAISYFIFKLTIFIGFGLHVANKMFLNSGIITIASVINILINIILIPRFGMYGAAFSTIFSFICVNILYFFIARRYWSANLSFLYPYFAGIPFLFIYLIYIYFISGIGYFLFEIVFSIALLGVYLIILLFFRMVALNELLEVRKFVLSYIKKRQ